MSPGFMYRIQILATITIISGTGLQTHLSLIHGTILQGQTNFSILIQVPIQIVPSSESGSRQCYLLSVV